ncbi:MAG: hypothetical protein PHI23_02335 [Candidatus Peribacteraceae bacterium]|nr:hypothetical protein [Candidatus Peribacteraceae bacterium]
MLSFAELMRFALRGSPTRERREIMLAGKKDDKPQPEDQARTPEGQEPVRTLDDSQLVEVETRDTQAKISEILRVLDSQDMFESLRDPQAGRETFDQLLAHEETTAETNLSAIAQQAGIAPTMAEHDSPLPEGTPREVLSAILKFDEGHSQVLTSEMKRSFLEGLLRASPRVAAAFAHSALDRLAGYENLQERIETAREFLKGKGVEAEGMGQATQIALKTVSLQEGIEAVQRVKPDIRPEEIRDTLNSASIALRKTQEYGSRYWQENRDLFAPTEEGDINRKEYLTRLRTQARDLCRLVNIQVRTGAQETAQRIEESTENVLKRTREADLEDDVQASAADPGMRALELLKRADDPTNDLPQNPDHPDFRELTGNFLEEMEMQLAELASVQRDAGLLSKRWEEHGTAGEQKERAGREAWLARCRPMIALASGDSTLEPDTRRWLTELQGRLESPAYVFSLTEQERDDFEMKLAVLCDRGQHYLAARRGEAQEIEGRLDAELRQPDTTLLRWIEGKEQDLTAEEQRLKSLMVHPICGALHLAEQVQAKLARARAQAEPVKSDLRSQTPRMSAKIAHELTRPLGFLLEQMRTAEKALGNLEEQTQDEHIEHGSAVIEILPKEEHERLYGKTRGVYHRGKIHLRQRQPDETLEDFRKTVTHEKAHFIIAIFAEQSSLLPTLIDEPAEQMQQQSPATFQALEARGGAWGITREEARRDFAEQAQALSPELLAHRVERRYRNNLVEEALVRNALREEGIRTQDDEVFAALTALEQTPPQQRAAAEEPESMKKLTDEELYNLNAQAMAEGGEGGEEHQQRGENFYDAKEDLEAIDRMITNIRTFGEAYPKYQEQVAAVLGGENGYRENYNELLHIYEHSETRAGQQVDPSHNTLYERTVKEFMAHVTKTNKKVKDLDAEFSDITETEAAVKPTLSQKLGIQWLCIYDVIRIYEEFKEDVHLIWKSMQDEKTSNTKAALTKNLPVKIPGTNIKIPILGNYTVRLSHYTERRRNQLELDRVKKWEDAFTNLDAEELIKFIGETPTKDQLRASIELLVKKGRMNWGDHRLWKALNEKSKYKMPFRFGDNTGPCDRDPVLRDKWLHKLISDIWRDKDMFDQWMTGNDGNYDKEKKSYTHAADNYSNIAGQMSHELKFILEKFVDYRTNRPGEVLPEEVNPHHYEEILHYAMRNGKMSMEQKFYHLVRGVATGLLPLSRLRVLAGERGELLMKFPFLDYFYQRHNTLAEVKRVADQITETDEKGTATFEPGTKSTMFIRLILLRDQKARERMSKAMDRVAESLDHEDIPYLATDIDWAKMQRLLGVISGDRSKMTTEGMKNAYVGFNEKFKVYANLAKLAEDGQATFTDADVQDLAQSLAAYVFLDNQAMRAVNLVRGQVSLTRAHLETEGPVTNPSLRTSAYRNRTRDFVWELAAAVGMSDADLNVEGLTLRDFLATRERDEHELTEEMRGKVTKATPFFCRAFEQKIMSNSDVFRRKLIAFEGGSFASGKSFLDSGCSERGPGFNHNEFRERYPTVKFFARSGRRE